MSPLLPLSTCLTATTPFPCPAAVACRFPPSYTELVGYDCRHLAALKNAPRLHSLALNLSSNQLGSAGNVLAALSELAELPALRCLNLDLSGNRLVAGDTRMLANLKQVLPRPQPAAHTDPVTQSLSITADTFLYPICHMSQLSGTLLSVPKPNGIHLSAEPKRRRWRWIPYRFINIATCHTHDTKWL